MEERCNVQVEASKYEKDKADSEVVRSGQDIVGRLMLEKIKTFHFLRQVETRLNEMVGVEGDVKQGAVCVWRREMGKDCPATLRHVLGAEVMTQL